MRDNPELVISRPYPSTNAELAEAITAVHKELVAAGMVWAELETDEANGLLVARGWKTGPNGASQPSEEDIAVQIRAGGNRPDWNCNS